MLGVARLPKRNGHGMGSLAIGSGTMTESRQLSTVKMRHMAVLMTLSFLVYSTTSTLVFQVRCLPAVVCLPYCLPFLFVLFHMTLHSRRIAKPVDVSLAEFIVAN